VHRTLTCSDDGGLNAIYSPERKGSDIHEALTSMQQNHSIDILGCSPFLYRLYTQLCIIFAVSEPSSTITNTLRDGLDRLAEGFP
jgi:hypothetical protein